MSNLSGQAIGLVGLGLMGLPMARNLLKAGAALIVHNRSPGPAATAAAEGMATAASPQALAQSSDIIVLMVADTPAVEAVLTGPQGVIAGLRPDALVIDMGTTEVPATRRLAEAVIAAGGDYVDAPVSGGQIGAVEATLTIMAGGSEAAFARALPVFQALGRRVTHVGGTGAGQVAKAANQMIVGLTIGAISEAFTLARAAGVEPARLRQALEGGFAWSRIMEVHGQRIVEENFVPGGRARTQLKDLSQAQALAESLGLDLPALSLNRRLFERLVDLGHGDLDHSALIKVFEAESPAG